MDKPPPEPGDPEGSPDDLADLAGELVAIGRDADAERLLGRVLAREPHHEVALFHLGAVLLGRGLHDQAIETLEGLVAQHPHSVNGYRGLAHAHRAAGRLEEAESFARDAVRIDPEDTWSHQELGLALAGQEGREDEAREALALAVELAPDDPDAHGVMSQGLLVIDDFEGAAEAAERAVNLAPGDPGHLMDLANAFFHLGRYDDARQLSSGILNDAPLQFDRVHFVDVLERWGIPSQFGDVYAALKAATGAPDLSRPGAAGDDPALLDAQAELVERLLEGFDQEHTPPDLARRLDALLDGILAADPRHGRARRLRARVAAERDDPRAAADLGRALLRDGDDEPEVFEVVIEACDDLGEPANGLEVTRAALASHPDDEHFRWYESYFLLELGEVEAGLAAARAIPAGGDGDAGFLLGRALYQAGDLDAAEAALREAIDAAPAEGEAMVWLALLLHQRGDEAAAAAQARDAAAAVIELRSERAKLGCLLQRLAPDHEPAKAPPGAGA